MFATNSDYKFRKIHSFKNNVLIPRIMNQTLEFRDFISMTWDLYS